MVTGTTPFTPYANADNLFTYFLTPPKYKCISFHLLHRHIARVCALEDPVHEAGGAPEQVVGVMAIRREPSGLYCVSVEMKVGNTEPRREISNLLHVHKKYRIT
jgi:hypothetical protein